MVVTPEMALPGYCIGDLVEDTGFLAANERAMRRIADAARGITAVVGFIDFDPKARNESGAIRKYNAAAVIRDGQRPAARAQDAAPELPLLRRQAILRARRACANRSRSPTSGGAIAPRRLDLRGLVGRVLPRQAAGGTGRQGRGRAPQPERVAVLSGKAARARRRSSVVISRILRKPLVYINTTGAADNGKNIIPFDGESLVYDADGRLIAIGRQFAGGALVVDRGPRRVAAPELELPPLETDREMYDGLVMALRDYMRKTGFDRAVVAVSGGIDSALALAIAVDALGPDTCRPTTCRRASTPRRRGRSRERLARACGVAYGVIPIQEIDEHVRAVFETHAHPIARSFTARESARANPRAC